MALTLRLTEKEEKELNELKERYVIKSSSKMVLRSIYETLYRLPELEKQLNEEKEKRRVIEIELQTLILKIISLFDHTEAAKQIKQEIKDLMNYKPIKEAKQPDLNDDDELDIDKWDKINEQD